MATRPTRSRKRRHRSSDSDVIHSRTLSPPSKRRRLTTSVLPSRSASKQYENRQHWMRDNLTKLRNDNKISDVTFVLPAKPGTPRTNRAHSEHNNDAASLSDDDQPSNTTKTFKCIRALFAANSEVFKAMLYGNMQESRHNAEIEITDISCRAFEYIRDLFYHFNPVLTSSIVLEVAVAASKYCIDHLIEECVNHLRNVSNLDEWHCLIHQLQEHFQHSSCFGMDQYLRALIDENYMVNNCSRELCRDLQQFYALSVDTLCRILRSDNFNAPEEWIWTKCIGFAIEKCKQQCSTNSIPLHIKNLVDAHLHLPKQLMSHHKRHTAGYPEYGGGHRTRNWERIYVKREDLFPGNNVHHHGTGDIVIESADDDEDGDETLKAANPPNPVKSENAMDLTTDKSQESQLSHQEVSDGKEMEPENVKQFVSTFKEIMLSLSQHIRFPVMNALFFIKLVQRTDILPAERIVDIQNWKLCRVRPYPRDSLVTSSRKRRYLRYFHRIQSGEIEELTVMRNRRRRGSTGQSSVSSMNSRSERNNNPNDPNGAALGSSNGSNAQSAVEDEGKSEDQSNSQQQNGGRNGANSCPLAMKVNVKECCFDHYEICFDGVRCHGLNVNDHIDHRDNVGRFATAIIVDVDERRDKVKLHYIGWQSKWDLWCDVSSKENQIRFCDAGAISTRTLNRTEFFDVELKDLRVKCRLARYWYQNHPDVDPAGDEWRDAQIKRVDKHSGQVQLVVRIGNKDYLWWVHLDSIHEVKPCEDSQGERMGMDDDDSEDDDDFAINQIPMINMANLLTNRVATASSGYALRSNTSSRP